MLRGLFGANAITSALRGGLEELSATHRAIGDRVAASLEASSSVDFAEELAQRTANAQKIQADIERDMASLADTQLRYEADAKLLQEAYARLRTAMRDRG